MDVQGSFFGNIGLFAGFLYLLRVLPYDDEFDISDFAACDIYVYIHICMHKCVCIYIYMYMYVCIFIYMYIYIYI